MDQMVDDDSGSAVRRYSGAAVALHWIAAAFIIVQVWLGLSFADMPKGPARMNLFAWHKTVGVAILLLAIVRLAVRLKNPPPPFPAEFPKWQRAAAVWSHRAFYFLIIALPLTGLMLVAEHATNGLTDLQFGLKFPVLPIPAVGETHVLLAWAMIALWVLHVAAALKQQFFDKTVVADRMPPFRSGRA